MKPWKRLTATLLAAALLLQLAACSATEGNDNVSSTQTAGTRAIPMLCDTREQQLQHLQPGTIWAS